MTQMNTPTHRSSRDQAAHRRIERTQQNNTQRRHRSSLRAPRNPTPKARFLPHAPAREDRRRREARACTKSGRKRKIGTPNCATRARRKVVRAWKRNSNSWLARAGAAALQFARRRIDDSTVRDQSHGMTSTAWTHPPARTKPPGLRTLARNGCRHWAREVGYRDEMR